jgi:outer membrane immunogenic protein
MAKVPACCRGGHVMNKFMLGSTALLAFAAVGSAGAADLPVKAPPMVAAPVFSWTGCYIGAHAGYGWGRNKNDLNDAIGRDPSEGPFENGVNELADYGHDTNGGVVGGQVGCNYQFPSNWVVGIEGEAWWSGMKGGTTTPEDGTDPGLFTSYESKNRWDADIALRLGYAWGRSLFYGKVGVVFGNFWYQIRHDDIPTHHACTPADFLTVCVESFTNTQTGLLLGAGWEYALTNNWSLKAEYNYIKFETQSLNYTASLGNYSNQETKQIVKVGVNYKFDWAGPVVARY